jgi:hypothetical protein
MMVFQIRSCLLLLAVLAVVSVACSGSQDVPESEPETALDKVVLEYNRYLKWGMYDRAADFVSPAHREGFLGRYEEKGEEFKIVSIEIRGVTYHGPAAIIESEQEWYDESMVVRKERFMEVWSRANGPWQRGERMTKKEYRKRKDELIKELKGGDSDDEDPTPEPAEDEPANEPSAES